MDLKELPGSEVVERFEETCRDCMVIRVKAVQNHLLWESYLNEPSKLIKLIGEANLIEMDVDIVEQIKGYIIIIQIHKDVRKKV